MELGKVAAHKGASSTQHAGDKGASSTQETRRVAAGKRRMHGGAREKEHQKGCQKVKTRSKNGKARHP